MGGEFLGEPPTKPKTNTEIFEECFPFHLAIGMSYAEYWTGDPTLVRYYRKAYLIRQEEKNNSAWLQGLYIYDAISTALHNALRGFGKSHSPARDYAKQPYVFNKKEKTEEEKRHEVEVEKQKAAAWMDRFVKMNQSQSHRA